MAHFLFNFSEGERQQARALLGAKMWGVARVESVVQRIDPTASSPRVQANAAAGFQMGVVRIDDFEYKAALALSRDTQAT